MWISTTDDVAQMIRDRRLQLGLSQQVLAQKVGVTRQWIGMLERGKPTVELAAVLKAITALGLRLDVRAPAVSVALEPIAETVAVAAVPMQMPGAGRPLRRLPTRPAWRSKGDDAARASTHRSGESA
jgi:HTH-type transcriptional regulator/antitoxin HipB